MAESADLSHTLNPGTNAVASNIVTGATNPSHHFSVL
jgi:hypothetical protein